MFYSSFFILFDSDDAGQQNMQHIVQIDNIFLSTAEAYGIFGPV